MNQIKATVKEIKDLGVVSYIYVQCENTTIKLIKQKVPQWLEVGDNIHCKFQEASVCVAKDCAKKVSVENCIPATLINVRKNEPLCELTFDSDIGKVVSLITIDAYEALELESDNSVTMLMRGIDINIDPILQNLDLKTYSE